MAGGHKSGGSNPLSLTIYARISHMQHFVLTRAAYAPSIPLEVNQYRLDVLVGITARSLAMQTNKDWTWAVMVHREDPLLAKRKHAFRAAGVPVYFIYWEEKFLPKGPEFHIQTEWGDSYRTRIGTAGWNTITTSGHLWGRILPIGETPLLMTRMDDDDAMFPTMLERVRGAADKTKGTARTTFSHPVGICVFDGKYSLYWHPSNMMTSTMTWPPDMFTAYEAPHMSIYQFGQVETVDQEVAWAYIRHAEAISYDKNQSGMKLYRDKPNIIGYPIDDNLRSLLPIDWSLLGA